MVKELAEAISALINGAPRSPRIDEIEFVIRQHVPTVSSGEVTRIDATALATALAPVVWPLGHGVKLDKATAEDLTAFAPSNGFVLYTAPLLLVDPRDGRGMINGQLINPPRVYALWYDDEMDCVKGSRLDWGAARALVPTCYDRLVKAWKFIKESAP